MIPLQVNDRRARDIEEIISLGDDGLRSINDELSSFSGSLDSDSVLEVFYNLFPKKKADALFSHAVSLCLLTDEKERDAAVVIDALRRGLERFGWEPEQLRRFDEISSAFENLLASDTLYLCAKSMRLFAADSMHLHEFRLFTEVRPVFDRDRNEIKAHLLYTVMSIIGSDASENEERVSIAIGLQELESLREECEKAIQKIAAYEASLQGGQQRQVIVYGKSHD